MLSPKRRGDLQRALESLKADILSTGPAKIDPNRKDPTTVGVADEDEQALSEMLQTLASQRNKKQSEELAKIHRALRKLSESPDEFGLCEECEEAIGAKRLELMPHVSLCAECQSAKDPKRGQARRNLTDFK